jgi:formyl-CoA transferase
MPGTTYPCAPDGPNDYVFITAQQQMWPAMAEAMGRPELADDPRFSTAEMRRENHVNPISVRSFWLLQRGADASRGDANAPRCAKYMFEDRPDRAQRDCRLT